MIIPDINFSYCAWLIIKLAGLFVLFLVAVGIVAMAGAYVNIVTREVFKNRGSSNG